MDLATRKNPQAVKVGDVFMSEKANSDQGRQDSGDTSIWGPGSCSFGGGEEKIEGGRGDGLFRGV